MATDVVTQQSKWDGTPSAEPTVKDFITGVPVSERQMDWIAEKPVIDIGNIISHISTYTEAQIFLPQDLIIPETDAPVDRVYVNGDEEEAYILAPGQNGEVRLSAQMVRDEPDVTLLWSSPSAGDGSEAVHWIVEREIVGDGDVPGTSSAQVTSTPTVPTAANEENHTTIDLGDLSGNKGKSLVLRVIRDGDNANDDSDQNVQLKAVVVN